MSKKAREATGWNMARGLAAAIKNPDSKAAAAMEEYFDTIEEVMGSYQAAIAKLQESSLRYRGTWSGASVTYARGDLVTYKGQLWHCVKETANRPGTDSWQLMTKADQ
jgi:hypothetical protein